MDAQRAKKEEDGELVGLLFPASAQRVDQMQGGSDSLLLSLIHHVIRSWRCSIAFLIMSLVAESILRKSPLLQKAKQSHNAHQDSQDPCKLNESLSNSSFDADKAASNIDDRSQHLHEDDFAR